MGQREGHSCLWHKKEKHIKNTRKTKGRTILSLNKNINIENPLKQSENVSIDIIIYIDIIIL